MDPSPKITNSDDNSDTTIEKKKRNKKMTIKYMDQPKAYLHGVCKLHYERKNKYKRRSHIFKSHKLSTLSIRSTILTKALIKIPKETLCHSTDSLAAISASRAVLSYYQIPKFASLFLKGRKIVPLQITRIASKNFL